MLLKQWVRVIFIVKYILVFCVFLVYPSRIMQSSLQIAKKFLEIGKGANDRDLTPMKLLKLVYIAHGWMLGLYARRLIIEDVEAWKYGPVIPELYREIKSYKDQPVEKIESVGDAALTMEETNILTQVHSKYGKFDGLKLSSLTHTGGTPWHHVWNNNPWGKIPSHLIEEYYAKLAGRE